MPGHHQIAIGNPVLSWEPSQAGCDLGQQLVGPRTNKQQLTDHGPQFRACLKKVVSFSDLRQDVERLSADALRVWGAGPRQAACLLVFVCYGERRHVKGLQHAPDRSRKNAATTGLTEAPSRQSITLAPTNLITVKEANRYVYGNDVELRDAVDKIRKVCDLPDGRLSTFREHDCPSTGSAIDSCDTRHNANTSPTLSSG
jgi:hypothetical protein